MNYWAIAISAVSVVISLATLALTEWRRRGAERVADVAATLLWLREKSQVIVDGQVKWAGYNLVIENRGPAVAKQVDLEVSRVSPENERIPLTLVDEVRGEFPVNELDAGARYPLRFVDRSDAWQTERRFEVTLKWQDGRLSEQRRTIPLRRGQTES